MATEGTVVLYLDLYFLMNMFVNLMLLCGVKQLTGGRRGWLRPFAAAVLGACWACALLVLWPMPGLAELLLTWFGMGSLMTALAFGIADRRSFLRRLCSLWFLSALTGGLLALFGEYVSAADYLTGGLTAQGPGWYVVCLWSAGLYFLICVARGHIRAWSRERNVFYEVTLFYHGRKKTVTALWDTGNHLFEPYGHQPVHVITAEACAGLCERVSKVIYIPFQAVGTSRGVLPGIQVDSMEVARDGRVIRSYAKPWLAVSREPLSPGKQYEMLLHGEEN